MTSLIDTAISFAAIAHRGQTRKGTDIPYIAHPYAVGMILMQADSSEEVVAAGILHDVLEDTPVTLEQLTEQFGEKVAEIVTGCSEPDKSLPWEERKRHTLDYLRTAPFDIKLVAAADKLHNIRSIHEDYHKHGMEIWDRFNRGMNDQSWYYQGIVKSLYAGLRADVPGRWIFEELETKVKELFL